MNSRSRTNGQPNILLPDRRPLLAISLSLGLIFLHSVNLRSAEAASSNPSSSSTASSAASPPAPSTAASAISLPDAPATTTSGTLSTSGSSTSFGTGSGSTTPGIGSGSTVPFTTGGSTSSSTGSGITSSGIGSGSTSSGSTSSFITSGSAPPDRQKKGSPPSTSTSKSPPLSDSGTTISPGDLKGAQEGLQAHPAGKLEESKPETAQEKSGSKKSSKSRSSRSKSKSESSEGSVESSTESGTTRSTTGGDLLPSTSGQPSESIPSEKAQEKDKGKSQSEKADRKSAGKKHTGNAEEKSSEKRSRTPEEILQGKTSPQKVETGQPSESTAGQKQEKASQGETESKSEEMPGSRKAKTEGSGKPEGAATTSTEDEPKSTATEDDTIAPLKKKGKPKSLVEADTLLLKNKFEAAEDAYRGLIPTDDTGDAYAGLAVALAKQKLPKKILEAEKIVRKGKEQFSDNPNMIAAGGYVSFVHSKTVASPAKRDLYLEAAESLSKRAVKASPDTVIAQQTLGLTRLAQDDPEGAVGPLRKAARMSEDPNSKALLAEALLKVDPHDEEAGTLADEALFENPYCHAARLQKAIVLTNKGKHEEAFTELLTIPRDQRDSEWNRVQGDIYRVQGDGPSALASWKEATRLDPRNSEPYKRLGEYYAMRGDGEFAIAEMHNALEILPNDLNLRGKLAELALRQDKLDVAEQEYRTILSVKNEDPVALLGLSRVFYRKAKREGQYPKEMQELMDKLQSVITEQSVTGQVVKGTKNLTEKIQLSEAEKALTQNRFREARQYFSQIISQHKTEPYELLTLGDQCYNDGELKSAEEAYSYARELPEVVTRAEQGISKITGLRTEAKRRTTLGNATWQTPDVAIDNYQQALIADPQHSEAFYGLLKIFVKTKRDDKQAIDYANSFLETSDDNDPLRKEVEEDLSKLKKRVRKQNSK